MRKGCGISRLLAVAPPVRRNTWHRANRKNKPTAPAAPSSSGGFSLGELKIADGQIAITDYLKRQARAVYDHIDVTLKNYAPGKPFSIDAAAHLPGSGSETLQLTGDGGPVNNADFASTPFKGSIKLKE